MFKKLDTPHPHGEIFFIDFLDELQPSEHFKKKKKKKKKKIWKGEKKLFFFFFNEPFP